MRVDLYGGFGEKGRTCLGVSAEGYRLLLDAGVKTSARGTRGYYPALTHDAVAALDAIVITHAHEDHVAALGWCLTRGFRGRILMTAETRQEADASIAAYGSAAEHAAAQRGTAEALPLGSDALRLGPFNVSAGRSGHMAGSVWLAVDDGRTRLVYCGDMVSSSPVFATDPVPTADAIVFDASYGDDDTPFAARVTAIHAWLAAHPQGCVLPTPLYGRSAELCAIVDGPLALAPGMRAALAAQRDGKAWLQPGVAAAMSARLSAACDWQPGSPLPRAALLCADGMGLSGPSQAILAMAAQARHPTLFTGHLPEGSPGAAMARDGLAGWIRLPTHPTRGENVALVAASKATRAIGHSCDAAMLVRLAAHIPALDATLATGDALEL